MPSQSDIETAKKLATDALKEGSRNLAVKIYRSRLGVDQTVAEQMVEEIERELKSIPTVETQARALAQPPSIEMVNEEAQSLRGSPSFAPSPSRSSATSYQYKMVQVPPVLKIRAGDEAAVYLEAVVNDHARQGWEFYRVDTIGIVEQPGCLGILLGQKQTYSSYYVISFRRNI